MNVEELLAARQKLRQQTPTVVTDKKLNQYQEILQPDGTYLRKSLGNKKEDLSLAEQDYFLDKQLACILDNQLYLSNADVARDRQLLLDYGITHILNLATGVGELFPKDFVYLSLEINDVPTEQLSRILPAAFKFIDMAFAMQRCCKVLVHCNQGISRSASVVIAYLMQSKQMRLTEAYDQVLSRRSCIQPNYGFMRQLKLIEREIFKDLESE